MSQAIQHPHGTVGERQRLGQLRRGVAIAIAAWIAFAALDWYIVHFIASGPLTYFLSLRLVGLVLLLLGLATLYARNELSGATMLTIDTVLCGSLSALIAAQSIEFRGIVSPLALGVVSIVVYRGAVLADHYKRSLPPLLATALAYPAVLFAFRNTSSLLQAQFGDNEIIASFVVHIGFIFAAALLSLIGGHVAWSLRTEVAQHRDLGRYRLIRQVGNGGMGEIWAAYHVALKRQVAVKLLRPESASDETAVLRFKREARATAELGHPNTVRVYDYGVTDDGTWYYAMELLEGEDLSHLIKRGPIDPMRAIDLIHQASRALAEAHVRGIVHRDVKPGNIFICSLGSEVNFVKVLDFGLAKLAEGSANADLTQTGLAVGTPQYVSPEVVMGNGADARSDVYALGAVLYAMVAGVPPFHGDDMRTLLLAHLRDAPQSPSAKLGRPLPRNLEALIMRCLAKDPDARYPNAGALASALRECRADIELQERGRRREAGAPNPHKLHPPHRQTAKGHGGRAGSPRKSVLIPRPVAAEAAPTFLPEGDWAGYVNGG